MSVNVTNRPIRLSIGPGSPRPIRVSTETVRLIEVAKQGMPGTEGEQGPPGPPGPSGDGTFPARTFQFGDATPEVLFTLPAGSMRTNGTSPRCNSM